MAQNRNFNSRDIAAKKREFNNFVREAQIDCDHKDAHGPNFTNVHDNKVMVKGKDSMGPNTFQCDECGDIVNFDAYTSKEANSALGVLYDICNQTKVLADLTDREFDNITTIMRTLDNISSSLIPFYLNKVINPLSNNKGRKNNNNGRSKGKISVQNFNR